MPKVIESMTRIQIYPYIIRVWRAEESVRGKYDNSDLDAAARKAANDARVANDSDPVPCSPVDVAIMKTLEAMPRVNAVEIVHKDTGNGMLVYPEWP